MRPVGISIAVLMIAMVSSIGLAHRNVWSLKDTVPLADLILVAEVAGIENAESGYRLARIKPMEIIKSGTGYEDKPIEYGNPAGGPQDDSTEFRAGERYILFLRSNDKCYRLVGNHGDQYAIDTQGRVRGENGDVVTVKRFVKRIRALIEGCK